MTFKTLDCTIRDGGHLNGWNFDDSCVRASYYAAVKCGVDYFEVGYRFNKVKPEWGAFAKCDDGHLSALFDTKENCKLTVMIDAGKSDVADFKPCKPENTPVKAVRVATYPYEIEKALSDCKKLKDLGYEVFLNLMVISEFQDEHFKIIEQWPHKEILQSLNFADSFGSFVPDDIVFYINKLKGLGFKRIGFHSHNNLQLAFANSLKAIESGAYMVDASIYGMGRGSGNLPIEIWTAYLSKTGRTKYNPVAYIDVVNRFYLDLKKNTQWGYRLESLIGGIKNVHPYYIDSLFKKDLFTVNEVWTAAELVKKHCSISFNDKELSAVLEDKFVKYDDSSFKHQINIMPEADAFTQGAPEFKNILKGKKVLVLGSGPSVTQKQKEILDFARRENCLIIATNAVCGGYNPKYHVFAGRKRFLKNAPDIYKDSTVIVPSFFGRELVKTNTKNPVMYFDIKQVCDVNAPLFDGETYCLAGINGMMAGLLSAAQMGAKEIYAAGLDGFGTGGEIVELFYRELKTPQEKKDRMCAYEKLSKDLERLGKYLEANKIPFAIITPTSHEMFYHDLLNTDKEAKI